jgi:hypothetical protein
MDRCPGEQQLSFLEYVLLLPGGYRKAMDVLRVLWVAEGSESLSPEKEGWDTEKPTGVQ